jgi:hypothetical protein
MRLNAKIDAAIAELKKTLAEYHDAKAKLESGVSTSSEEVVVDGKKTHVAKTAPLSDAEKASLSATVESVGPTVPSLDAKVKALSRERIRFSNEASIALAMICDEIVQELVTHTMDRVLAAKKKIIQICHLHEAGVEQLPLYPLVKSLPSFAARAAQLANTLADEKASAALATALTQAEKEWRKKHSVVRKRTKEVAPAAPAAQPAAAAAEQAPAESAAPAPESTPAPAVPAAAEEAPEESDDDAAVDVSDSKTSFKFYVHQVCKNLVKKDERYKSVRVSTEIRGYLSDLLVEFIQRLAPLVALTASAMKNKTVNDSAILRTVKSLLIDGHASEETIELLPALVDDPAAVKAETLKRDEEKKAGRKYKIDMTKIPQVNGFKAVHTVKYPTSGYAELEERVKAKLEKYSALPPSEQLKVAEEVSA